MGVELMIVAQVALISLGLYGLVGVVFACLFVLIGAGRIDSVAAGAPLRLRVVFAPGAAILWPVLGMKWWRTTHGGGRGDERGGGG